MQVQSQVGPVATTQSIAPGSVVALRSGNLGDTIVSELHGRFYEQTYRNNLFSTSMSATGALTALSSANQTVANGLSATLATAAASTPILGIWNPATSSINAVILQATLGITQTALTVTGAGGFIWAVFTGNSNITTGSTPVNRKTLTASGSQCKGMSGNVALTGLTNIGVALATSALNGGSIYNVSEASTASGFVTQAVGYTENIDGSIIVPPGGVLALYATTTPVALSAVGSLLWEEVPV